MLLAARLKPTGDLCAGPSCGLAIAAILNRSWLLARPWHRGCTDSGTQMAPVRAVQKNTSLDMHTQIKRTFDASYAQTRVRRNIRYRICVRVFSLFTTNVQFKHACQFRHSSGHCLQRGFHLSNLLVSENICVGIGLPLVCIDTALSTFLLKFQIRCRHVQERAKNKIK